MAEQIRAGRDLFGAEHPPVQLPESMSSAVAGGESLSELESLAVADPKDSGVWAALAADYLRPVAHLEGHAQSRMAAGAAEKATGTVETVEIEQGDSVTGAGDADTSLTVAAYAYARTGYHRGLDALRSHGWRGTGPVPWSHAPNRSVLRAIMMLALAAEAIGEEDEHIRCLNLVHDCDPSAAEQILAELG